MSNSHDRRVQMTRRSLMAASGAAIAAPLFHSTVEAQSGGFPAAVGSSHELATEAGVAVLEAGGTAIDAAFAVASILSVVEPYFSHVLGGELWGLYYEAATGEITAIDGVGTAGSQATLEAYAPWYETRGMHQSIVPGGWDGWMVWLDRFGRIGLPDLLRPSVELARNGFTASPELGIFIRFDEDNVRNHPPTAEIYMIDGELVDSGQTLYNPDLADTFESLISAFGGGAISALNRGQSESDARKAGLQAARDYFYRGPIAEAIVAENDTPGNWFTLDDFANFEAHIVPAISIDYGETSRVWQCPPNSQGITMLLGLNILKHFDQQGLTAHDPDVVHAQIEAMKLAFGDRYQFIGDPEFNDIDIEWLLSDEHAEEQFARIDMNSAMSWPENAPIDTGNGNTTTIQVTDQYGNAVSITTSIGFQFRVITGTGININERMKFFSVDPENPNAVEPGKRVRHTSCPYIVTLDGLPWVLGGNTGVDTQSQVQLQQMMAAIDFSMSAQEAINQGRWVTTAMPNSVIPATAQNTLQIEDRVAPSLIAELESRGHNVVVGEGIFGSGGMIKYAPDRSSVEVGVDARFSTSLGVVVS